MVAKLRVLSEHIKASASQLFNWLVQCDAPGGGMTGDMRLYCE